MEVSLWHNTTIGKKCADATGLVFHDTFGISLFLEPCNESGQLVQSIMNKVKSVSDVKLGHLKYVTFADAIAQQMSSLTAHSSYGVTGCIEGLEQQMISDRKSSKGVNRPQIAAAADGRGEREKEKKGRKSVIVTDAQEYNGKPPRKPTKKGKEKEGELEEDQTKLSL